MMSPYRDAYQDRIELTSADAPGGMVCRYADGDEEIVHVNEYILRLFECATVDEFLDLVKGSFKNFVYTDDYDVTEDSIWGQVSARSGLDHVYYRIRTKSDRLVTVADYGRLVELGGHGRPIFYSLVTEVTPEETIDWLTGLPSMMRFHELAQLGRERICERGERPVALALDIMGMMSFNTRYGRSEGDRLLQAFANILRGRFGNEACSRFAEDHFYAYSVEEGIAARVQSVFDDFAGADFERVPPVRVGVYALDPDDDIVDVAFDRAKAACDLDRKTWKSHLSWFTDEMRRQAHLRNHVLESIDEAIEKRWIRPFYQAIVRSSTGDICNEEALARWIDPTYGSLLPFQFIGDLEDAGLLYKLDLHIVDCVIEDFERKRAAGITLVPVSMNFSLRDLVALDLAEELSRRCDAAAVPRGLLRVELTESVASSNPQFLRKQIAVLHEAGFEVWMDDFGSGYSSLNTLQEFDFDVIKLDMGFLRSAEVEKSHVILAGVVQAAATLGVGTLTEGVETVEQAQFLASIGCDMLQGYFYARPVDIDQVIAGSTGAMAARREEFTEARYWSDVSLVSFTNLVERSEITEGWTPMSELPVAILERRRGDWSILRANELYIQFLQNAGVIDDSYSEIEALPIGDDVFDPEFYAAVDRSLESGGWERIFGSLEYGTGYQFFVSHQAQAAGVDAFLVAAAPSMLGASLGAYGDVPVAYAVFRLKFNEAGDEVVDAAYVYANRLYCEMGGYRRADIIGKSFLEVASQASSAWFSYCYRAVVLGETVHDVIWSPETGHWLSFNVAPTSVANCCAYAFTIADDERRERDALREDLTTSDLIIRITDALSTEMDYEVAMEHMLEAISSVLNPERLCIFECGDQTCTNTFEWVAPGITARKQSLQMLDSSKFEELDARLRDEGVFSVRDASEFRIDDARAREVFESSGTSRLIIVPLTSGNNLLGHLSAQNCLPVEGINAERLMRTVASFVSARIANRRLMEAYERMGTYDELTGMLSRRGIDRRINEWISGHEDEPFSLMLMDIDDFKALNDTMGHDAGDAALRMMAKSVEDVFPDRAVVGRNGGDEFLAFLPLDDGTTMRECLKALVNRSHVVEGQESSRLTFSAGYVSHPRQATSLRDAYTKADAALFSVKLSGKRGFRRYRDAMERQYRLQTGFTPYDIVKNVPGGIIVHRGEDDRILLANDEIVRMFGCASVDELLARAGGSYLELVHPKDRARMRDAMRGDREVNVCTFRMCWGSGAQKAVTACWRRVDAKGMGTLYYEVVIE